MKVEMHGTQWRFHQLATWQGAARHGTRLNIAKPSGRPCARAAVGREIGEIEVTALQQPEAYAAVGTATVMAWAMGHNPAASLELVYGPAMARLAEIGPGDAAIA